MKVIVLGGAGAMARVALEELAAEQSVTQVTVADYNIEGACRMAAHWGPRFSARKVDANDMESLKTALAGHDVALGFIGPFYRYETPIARACIEAEVDYVSISDDFDAYRAVRSLHKHAEDAGVTIVSGLGNSPGITNILAKKGALSMDNPERINVHWCGGSGEDVGPANIKHVMHIFSGYTPQWFDGREVLVKTGAGAKTVEFPAPIGRHRVYYTGHAESVSLPENMPDIREVTLHGGIKPNWVARFAYACGLGGLTATPHRRDILAKLLNPALGLFATGGVDKSAFRIDVFGYTKGQPRHHYYTGTGHIAAITSIPCVCGALMLARGEAGRPGVWAAEAVFEPDDFLREIAARGVELFYYEGMQQHV